MRSDDEFKPGDRVVKGYRAYTVTKNQGNGILSVIDDKGVETLLAAHEALRCPEGFEDQESFELPW